MKESLVEALISSINRNSLAVERLAEAQEKSNEIMREDIQIIRDIDLDEIVDEHGQSH